MRGAEIPIEETRHRLKIVESLRHLVVQIFVDMSARTLLLQPHNIV